MMTNAPIVARQSKKVKMLSCALTDDLWMSTIMTCQIGSASIAQSSASLMIGLCILST